MRLQGGVGGSTIGAVCRTKPVALPLRLDRPRCSQSTLHAAAARERPISNPVRLGRNPKSRHPARCSSPPSRVRLEREQKRGNGSVSVRCGPACDAGSKQEQASFRLLKGDCAPNRPLLCDRVTEKPLAAITQNHESLLQEKSHSAHDAADTLRRQHREARISEIPAGVFQSVAARRTMCACSAAGHDGQE